MKAALLLTEKAKTTRLMLKDVAVDELRVRDTDAYAGCKCDRWGHLCPECVDHGILPKAETSVHHQSKQ